MLFNSLGYLLLLVLAVPLHWLLPNRLRTYFLLVASVFFYAMWRLDFAFLVVFSALVDFFCAQRIACTEKTASRRGYLLVSLAINLGLLIFFKYTYFLSENVSGIASLLGVEVANLHDLGFRIILPLGISFYTFQTISYTIDVYRRVSEPTRSLPNFLAYVMFWPQLIAGPILRPSEVLPQLEGQRSLGWERFTSGILLILSGLSKKVVIADTLSRLVDVAFLADVGHETAIDVWVASFLFGFQIYFDFSGYSDVAIGSARLLGFDFPKNFDWPYMALSPRDFWHRWHISLSSWIRDYLYLPLTGQHFQTKSEGGIGVASEGGGGHRLRALFLTWFTMGLWHGAAWTFVMWGIYHAVLVQLYRGVKALRVLPERAPVVAWMVMLPLAMAGWIPFRAHSVEQALLMFGKLLDPRAYLLTSRALPGYHYLIAAVLTVGMAFFYLIKRAMDRWETPDYVAAPVMGCGVAVMSTLLLVMLRPVQQFIYFQF